MTKPVAIVIAAALAAGVGCSGGPRHGAASGGSGHRPTGIVAGTAWMIGGPAPGHRRLKRKEIEVVSGTRAVAAVMTDDRGRFHLSLKPGRYRFELRHGPDLMPPTVVVTAGQTTRLHLVLSVK